MLFKTQPAFLIIHTTKLLFRMKKMNVERILIMRRMAMMIMKMIICSLFFKFFLRQLKKHVFKMKKNFFFPKKSLPSAQIPSKVTKMQLTSILTGYI